MKNYQIDTFENLIFFFGKKKKEIEKILNQNNVPYQKKGNGLSFDIFVCSHNIVGKVFCYDYIPVHFDYVYPQDMQIEQREKLLKSVEQYFCDNFELKENMDTKISCSKRLVFSNEKTSVCLIADKACGDMTKFSAYISRCKQKTETIRNVAMPKERPISQRKKDKIDKHCEDGLCHIYGKTFIGMRTLHAKLCVLKGEVVVATLCGLKVVCKHIKIDDIKYFDDYQQAISFCVENDRVSFWSDQSVGQCVELIKEQRGYKTKEYLHLFDVVYGAFNEFDPLTIQNYPRKIDYYMMAKEITARLFYYKNATIEQISQFLIESHLEYEIFDCKWEIFAQYLADCLQKQAKSN